MFRDLLTVAAQVMVHIIKVGIYVGRSPVSDFLWSMEMKPVSSKYP